MPTKPHKYKLGDRVRIRGAETDGLIVKLGFNDGRPINRGEYTVLRDDGQTNGHDQPVGYNFHENDLTLLEAAAIVSFDSVILSPEKKQEITDAISQVDNHDLIFKKWGFSEIFEKGTAISLLFYGPPGTGKTLMAQAVADKYGKKLVMISTAEIETPEPGGAERNIKTAFEKAQKNQDVLLFDECDSLITDRSRVGMILAAQINSLLTALENYNGIVVFTTNRLGALDPAFDRRLSLKLEFPMPTPELRELIWKRMFPGKCPLAKDIQWTELSQIEIAGGHIKNVVLKAARRAAASGAKEITNEHLWEALEKEVESLKAYKDALDEYTPLYGTPIKGGMHGGTLAKKAMLEKVRGKVQING